MNNKKSIPIEDIVTICNERHNDIFTVVSFNGQTWDSAFTEIFISSKNLDGARVNVRVYSEDEIYDNYIAVKYKTEVEKRVEPIVQEVYGNSKVVNVPAAYGTGSFRPDMSFAEYVRSAESSVHIAVATNASVNDKDKDLELLRAGLEKAGICSSVTVSYYKNEDINEIEVSDKRGAAFRQLPYVKGVASMGSDFSITYVNWSENDE